MASTTDGLQEQLRSLKLGSDAIAKEGDFKLALEAFSSDNIERRSLSVAYAFLASALLGTNKDGKDVDITKKDDVRKRIASILDSWLAETGFPELAKAFGALTAILEVDKTAFNEIMQMNALEEKVIDAGEIITAEYKIVDPVEYAQVKTRLACFISQAAAQMTPLAKKLANPDGSNWLYRRFNDKEEDIDVRAPAAVAFIKFQALVGPRAQHAAGHDVESQQMLYSPLPALLTTAKEAIRLEATASSRHVLQAGLEALGVATLKAAARRELAEDEDFMKYLLKVSSQPSYQYSTAVIFANLVKYPRAEDAEDKMKESLRRYAAQDKSIGEESESSEEMDERCSKLLKLGIMPCVVAYAKSGSPAVQRLCGSILLGLVEAKAHRGLIVQQGGAKALLEIIAKSSVVKNSASPAAEDFTAVQALAKLLITANPLLVLGPTPQSPLLIGALRILAVPIMYDGSTLLQRFESLMALTNIASLSEELQERSSSLPGFLDKVEDMIIEGGSSGETMDGKSMCRRAAVELLCNLASCETTFIRYTAIDKEDSLKDGQLPGPVASRINILLALTDAEDLPTRQAALGALATFTLAPTVASFIGVADKKLRRVTSSLSDDDVGMQLRAIECVKNIAHSVPAQKASLLHLLQALKSRANDASSSDAGTAAQQGIQDLT